MRNKTLEELENDFWEEPNEFPTGLIERCFNYRKIKISELSVGQLRTLISQKIGIKHLTEIALEFLGENAVIGDLFEGDLLLAVSKISTDYWNQNLTEFKKLKSLIESNVELIKAELGETDYEQIIERIKPENKRLINFQLDKSIEFNIVGREEELLDLNNLLDRNRVVQITDIGGIDKTAQAKLYINRYHKSYDVIIW